MQCVLFEYTSTMGLAIVNASGSVYHLLGNHGRIKEYMFLSNIPLAQYSNYKIGGPAKLFLEVRNENELIEALTEARRIGEQIFILGGGNNLLISDQGFKGIVIKVSMDEVSIEAPVQNATNTTVFVPGAAASAEPVIVRVGAGTLVSRFLGFTVSHALSGWEWAGGLPGTMGGAIWGNAGAFGGETKDSVIEVTSYTFDADGHPQMKKRTRADCQFEYRSSIFKTATAAGAQEVITSAKFQLTKGNPAAIMKIIEEKKKYRADKQPLEYPNVGSIFKNVPVDRVPKEVLEKYKDKIKQDPFPVIPTAVLISEAGLKGYQVGGAQVSTKHPNFIINTGSATALEVKSVMMYVREAVKQKFGVELEQEVIFVG